MLLFVILGSSTNGSHSSSMVGCSASANLKELVLLVTHAHTGSDCILRTL